MKKISHTIRRLIAWLNERDASAAGITDLREWADLPTHHPNN